MENDAIASIMTAIANLSTEVKHLRDLIDAEVIRADDMPILPVFQRDSCTMPLIRRETYLNADELAYPICSQDIESCREVGTEIAPHQNADTHITISDPHQAASDTDHQPANRPTRCDQTDKLF